MNNLSILGGGIGGLAVATCFRHFDIPFQLYEAAPELGEVGAGIGISESTVNILSMLGLKEQLLQKGRYVRDAVIVDRKGKTIRKLPITNGGFCIHRKDLIELLKKKIPTEAVHLGHKLVSFENTCGHIDLQFENKATVGTRHLVAADGINSLIRKKLFPAIEKRFSGQTVWRGISDIRLPEKYHDVYLEFWGDNLRFATIPLKDDLYYWYAAKEAPEGQHDDPIELKEYLKRLFKHHAEDIAMVIEKSGRIIRNDMYDLKPHGFPWHNERIVFLGDAIHATTPNLAQGGCQAIEDAFYLALLIRKHGLSENTFSNYRKDRLKKVEYIVKQSWRFGKTAHNKSRLSDWAMRSMFKLLPDRYFKEQYRRLIDIDYIKSAF